MFFTGTGGERKKKHSRRKHEQHELFQMTHLQNLFLRIIARQPFPAKRKNSLDSHFLFCYPENRVIGIVAPGGKGLSIWKNEQFIDMKNIVKIGDDVVLVNFNMPQKPCGTKPVRGRSCCPPPGINPPDCGPGDRRSYEEYE